jgi:hypothetical protein
VPRIWLQEELTLKTFFTDLLKDLWKLLIWFKGLYRKELVVGSVLILALAPEPHHVQAEVPHPTYIKPIKHLEPVPAISVAVPEEAAAVAVPEPVAPPPVSPEPVVAPVAPTGGCQTYFSGDAYLDNIIRYESGGNSCATNYLGCFGLLQACPGEPLKAACGGSPACQIAWFQANKTGGRSWAQVWQHELDYGWW